MRIAFITLGFKPWRASGLDISGERLVKALLDSGHQVTVISRQRRRIPEILQHPALRIYRLPWERLDWLTFGYQVARMLTSLDSFDIVHFWDIHFAWAYRAKYLASVHHSFRQRLESLGYFSLLQPSTWTYRRIYYLLARKFAEIPAIRRAQGLLAGSSAAFQEYVNNYSIPLSRISLTRHGVDTNLFHHIVNNRDIRYWLDLREDEPMILFAGFITPRKGLEYLARALPLICPTPKLILAGQWRNTAYRKYIWQLLNHNHMKEFVREIGFVPDELMPALFSTADVYVSTSLMEGFGLPLAEALACQTPVVAMEAGAVAEVVGPGGILVKPRDYKGFAEAVSLLLQNPLLRKEIGQQGRLHIEKEFSVETMLRETLKAYHYFDKCLSR